EMSVSDQAGDGTFGSAVNYGIYYAPNSVATGDFNEDEHIDLAVADDDLDNISILLGVGDGTFYYGPTYLAGDGTQGIASGDFDEDGHVDLVVANGYSEDISMFLGTGYGTFASAVNYGASAYANSVTAEDLDVDGHTDLAVANLDSNSVSILLGVGDGTFASAVNYGAGAWPISVTTGDFNENGHADLAVANLMDDNVSIFINLTEPTGTKNNPSIPVVYSLSPNYPNPFNPTTTIPFTLPKQCLTNLSIYCVEGSLIKTLVNETLNAGYKQTTWDGTNSHGNAVSSGVYFYRLKAGKKVLTRKMVLLK
ncbi:MAG: T9SS type A sorting domain-containing protein, partial [Candidatus Krumholzibacteria bacterium]|nr:T9SS type A sorting domain-containing protein [Candidatus Krumholzibacteria bacterium]